MAHTLTEEETGRIQKLHRATNHLIQTDEMSGAPYITEPTIDAERILFGAIREIRSPKETTYTMIETLPTYDSLTGVVGSAIGPDTPESLGEWTLELGDYHHRTAYCQEITHVNEIGG